MVAEPAAEPVAGDVYEDQGNGWYFRKFPDGTYDQKVYVIKDGFYVPHEEPSAWFGPLGATITPTIQRGWSPR